MSSEALFPRGPVSRPPVQKTDFKNRVVNREKLFKLKNNSIKKKKYDRRIETENDTEKVDRIPNLFQTVPDKITTFNYKKITEGLVIAGRIREINSSRLGISLPGRTLAHADISKISTPYTEQLQSLSSDKINAEEVAALSEMFQIGEMVTVVVDSVSNKNGKFNVSVSLDPCHVNKTLDMSSLVENMVVVGAIKSIEDHGYVVDLGIKNLVAFLPKKNVDGDAVEGLVIGKIVRAVVSYVKRKSTTTVTLSIMKDTLLRAVPLTGYSNSNLLPGTQIKVHVIKVLPDGLVVKPVKASGDVTGHVNLNNLPSCWDTTSRFKPGMEFLATLLYTIPHANIMYFSLWPHIRDINPQRPFHDGALVKNAKVVALAFGGTNFQLGSNEMNAKGVVSISQANGKEDFKVGDEHTVRILHYDLMEGVYICSMKPELLSIEVYSTNDLQVGQVIEGKVIRKVPKKGVHLQVGNVSVFAPHLHLTDFPQMSRKDNVLSPLCKINAVVKAKVLSKRGNSCFVTLKPMLVKTVALCNYSDAKIGSCYYGTVKSLVNSGMVVWFFNDITGFIPNSEIEPLFLKPTFHVGQSIRCYVKAVDPVNEKLILTLTPSILNKGYSYGSSYALTVIESDSDGLKVKVPKTEIDGFLPFHQLSDHISLLEPLKDHYTPGSRIKSAVVYSSDLYSAPLFSLRSSVLSFFELNNDDITTLNLNMQKDEVVVPCSITEIDESGLNVEVCIPNSKHRPIPKENIIGYDKNILSSLSANQAILAVSTVKNDDFQLKLNRNKFYDISEVGHGIDLLLDYLKSSKLLQIISICEKTQATVTKIKNKSVLVKLPSLKSKGTIHRRLCNGSLKENDSFEVILLWQSPITKVIHALPKEKQGDVPEEPINGPKVGQTAVAEVVLVENDFAIGLIPEGPFKSRIAFFPVKSHLNDFGPSKLQLFSTVRIIPVLLEDRYVIAVDESKLKKHSQTTGRKLKEVLSELLDNVNTYFNKRETVVLLNFGEDENDFSEQVLENGIEESDAEKDKAPKKQRKRKKDKKSNFDENGTWEQTVADGREGDSHSENYESPKKKKIKKEKKSDVSSQIFDENGTWEQTLVNGHEGESHSENDESPKKKKKKEKDLTSSIEDEIPDQSFANGIEESESDIDNESQKKKKESSELSSASNYSFQVDVIENSEVTSKKSKKSSNEDVSTSKVKKQKLSLEQSSIEETLNEQSTKKSKRSKAGLENDSLLNGDDVSLPENRKRKSSISQFDELDTSVSDETVVGKKRKSCEGDVSVTDSRNESLTVGETKSKKKKKTSLENTGAENTNQSNNQNELKSRLSLEGYDGFSWSVDAKDFSITQGDNDDDSEDDDDETGESSSKKTRSQMTTSEKRAAAKEAELRLRRAEQLLLEAESNPQSVDHFERLVLAHPNSSMLWIKYMALHLQETEIDKARAVAKRALQVMNAREEEERLNVWTALLNLENLYGSEESLKSALAEAVRTNDDYQVYSKMLEIYADSKKTKSVEQLAAMMSKKFKSKVDCWLLCCRNLMRVGSLEKARSFFQRGLEALTKKDHVQFITRFALLENALGSFDHAQTVMDHVLMTYPGRIPAWTTYVDMLTKSGHTDLARQVLQRSVNQKLPVKKMKTLYKKWLDFEQQHGTQTNITHVKNLAEQYVNSLSLKIEDLK